MSTAKPSRWEKGGPGSASTAGSVKEDEAKKESGTTSGRGSWVLDKLSVVADNLETYQGRDTLITLLHYIALILADMCTYFRWGGGKKKNKMSERFVNMFVQLSNCRVMLRLLDDFGAIRDYYRFYKDENAKVIIIIIEI